MHPSPPPSPQQDPRTAYPAPPLAPGVPVPPGPGYPAPGAGPGYPPLPTIPPAAFTRRYRTTAWVLVWVPVGLMVAAGALSVALLAYADSDPSNNSAAGYLALLLWGVMLVGGPVLLGAFIPGCVMLSRSNRARALTRTTGYRPPA